MNNLLNISVFSYIQISYMYTYNVHAQSHYYYSSELYGALDQRHDLKWKFSKEVDVTGVYDDFSTLVPGSENKAETTPIVSFSIMLHI